MKTCSNPECDRRGELLPLSEFYVATRTSSGHTHRCKRCIDPESRARRRVHQRANRPAHAARAKAGRIAHRGVALDILGGRCLLCDERDRSKLVVHHASFDGDEHRAQIGRNHIFRWVCIATETELFKWNLQLLCDRCHRQEHAHHNKQIKSNVNR